MQAFFPAYDVERGAAFGAGFLSVRVFRWESRGREPIAARELGLRRLPMQAPRNHQSGRRARGRLSTPIAMRLPMRRNPADGSSSTAEIGGSTVRKRRRWRCGHARAVGQNTRPQARQCRRDVGQFRHWHSDCKLRALVLLKNDLRPI